GGCDSIRLTEYPLPRVHWRRPRMKVLIFTKYSRMGASSRLRTLQYVPYLESVGVDVAVQQLFDDRHLAEIYNGKGRRVWRTLALYFRRLVHVIQAEKFDLVLIEKELFPYVPHMLELYLKIRGIPFVVDYDDAIFHNYDASGKWIVRFLLKKKIAKVMSY